MLEKLSEWVPAIIAGVVGIILALIAWGNRKESDSTKTRTMNPPDWTTVWIRLDTLEKKQAASSRLLSQVILQWPKGYPPPVLDPDDMKILEDTLPVGFWPIPNSDPTH